MKPDYPEITVILPTYNSESFVAESIQSVLDQTFANFELLIIDDASTDNTLETIKKFNDSRIQLIVKQEHSGYTDSLNYGIEIAKGRYIARMDSDDISLPTRFEKQIGFLESHDNFVLCASWCTLIPNDQIVERPSENDDLRIALLSGNPLIHSTVMIRKEIFNKEGFSYKKEFEPAEDYELWTKMIGFGSIYVLPDVLIRYRLHSTQVSVLRQKEQLEKVTLCRVEMIKYLLPEPTEVENHILEQLLFRKVSMKSANVNRLISFLNNLVSLNEKQKFFKKKEFLIFIEEEKRKVIRDHYIFRKNFSPGLLSHFYRSPRKEKYLTGKEKRRLLIKCLLFQKNS